MKQAQNFVHSDTIYGIENFVLVQFTKPKISMMYMFVEFIFHLIFYFSDNMTYFRLKFYFLFRE